MQSGWTLRAEGGSAGMVSDPAEVRRALMLFADPEHGCELMALRSGAHRTLPGDDLDGLCKAVNELPHGVGIYFRINPVPPELDRPARKGDILRRRWLFIDIDPLKPQAHKEEPASDTEKAAAGEVCDAVVAYLSGLGWPAPVIADSGNGYALDYRCELANDKLTQATYQRLLKILSEKCAGAGPAVIDRSVHNPNRLQKLPGTWARKGPQSDDRPHRPCRLLCVPAVLGLVTPEMLLAAAGVSDSPPPSANGKHPGSPKGGFNPDGGVARCRAYLARVGPAISGQYGHNRTFQVARLIWNDFGIDEPDGWELLVEFNARCEPPWEETKDLRHKWEDAKAKGPGPEGRGYRLAEGRSRTDPRATWSKPGPKPPPEGQVIYWAESVTPRAVEWLWPGRVPLGKLTTFAGNGGLGKTFVLCDIVARITTGREWPVSGGECALRGKCLFISGEDDPEDTLVPRLIELGADLSRVAFLTTSVLDKFTLCDLATLEKALEQMGDGVRFVAIDPPTAYLGGVDDHKNSELRGLLTPLAAWAHRRRLALVFNTHVNKPPAAKVEAMMRVMGSVAWVNAMRSAYMFARDPVDPERRLFIGMKNNLGRERKGLAYRIAPTDSGLARVEWLGEVDTTADDAVNSQGHTRRAVVASVWLAQLFKEVDRLPSDAIWQAAARDKVSKNALKEAKDEMGIRARQEADGDGERIWWWFWLKDAREAWAKQAEESEARPEGVS